MKYETTVVALITSLLALIGLIVGSFLTHKSSQEMLDLQQKTEMRIRSYAKIMGLKIRLTQSIRTLAEAKMLCEYYETRYLRISHNNEDLQEAKRQNERALALIPSTSDLQRELHECLGEIQISYVMNDELSPLVAALHNYQMMEITFDNKQIIKTQADLDAWKEAVSSAINSYIEKEFRGKFNALIPVLLKQTKRA